MKSEVYSWRLSPGLKTALEEAAREEHVSVSALLERIAREWLRTQASAAGDDELEQQRLHASAMRFVGTIRGGDPDRSENVRQRVRERLERKRAR